MGFGQHGEKRPQFPKASDRLFQNLLRFDPVIRVALHHALLPGRRQNRRHPIADEDK